APQPAGGMGDGPARPVVPADLAAYGAAGRVTLADPDAATQPVVALPPRPLQLPDATTHGHRHADGALNGIWYHDGVVEENHQAVPGEALERALMLEDELAHRGVIFPEDTHDFFGLRRLVEWREAPEVEEHDGHLPPVRLQR